MPEGMIRTCPSCGKKNRILYARLDKEARCGSCAKALPPPSDPAPAPAEEVTRG